MATYVRNYVKGCTTCQQFKIDRRPWKGPFHPIAGPKENATNPLPFKMLTFDLLTDLPPSEGYDTLLVVVDHGLTKGIILIPTNKTATSTDIAELFRDYVFKRFGIPIKMISDRDPRFASEVFREFLRLIEVDQALSTAYHPQTDGASERVMQEIEAYLSIYCLRNPTEWIQSISMLEFSHNSRPHADRKQTPFELMYGYQPIGYPKDLKPSKSPHVEEHLSRLNRWRLEAAHAHELAKERMEEHMPHPFSNSRKGIEYG